ncbi:MAG TPA: LUD domain-containing protein [Bacteroidales bacterium]|nr:LUD domain-containing protein [Bacteroidales bacterium]
MSRDRVIQKIRQHLPAAKFLPDEPEGKIIPDPGKLKETFIESLKQTGASCIELPGNEKAAVWLAENYPAAVDLRKREFREMYSSDCPKEKLAGLETVILEGQFGVAENGAIWIDETDFPNRLFPFITLKLVIMLDKNKLVSDMHEAYRRIDLQSAGFGLFISGPSKTADIEQSLVYGAHGAMEMGVVMIG